MIWKNRNKKVFVKWLIKQRKIRSDKEVLDGLIKQLKTEIKEKTK